MRILLEDFFGIDLKRQLMEPNLRIDEWQYHQLEEAVRRLQDGEPVQYVTGVARFGDLLLKVTPDVLIPRPETLELVQKICTVSLPCHSSEGKCGSGECGTKPFHIWDIGTGSGCIAIALAMHFENAEVIGFDVSEKALQIAKENAESNGVKVRFVQDDVLHPQSEFFDQPVDLVVSNPPYVCDSERAAMEKNVLDWEPGNALFVPDQDPLRFYRQILFMAKDRLNPDGQIWFEINERMGEGMLHLCGEMGFAEAQILEDFAGKPRFCKVERVRRQRMGNSVTFAGMKTNVSLRSYNSFGFDVVAKFFAEINDIQELEGLIRSDEFKKGKHLILSGGNNVLFQEDCFDGLVVYINTKGIEVLREDENKVIVRAQAGEDWPEFVRFCVGKGWHGLENLAHIPGKVGAAPVQNIGAYGMELKDSFLQCEAIQLATGQKRVFNKEDCRFGYRESVFKNTLKGQYIITSVDFLLQKNAPLHLEYGNIKAYLEQNGIESPTLLQLHDAICAIRDTKLPDVKQIGSAGSFFKNPVIEAAQFEALKKDYPDIPHYPDADGRVKVPAGWLIEQAGWKGWRDEHVGVYEKQALVLVHYGGGKGHDIVELAQKIQASVEAKFGIRISPEVNIL